MAITTQQLESLYLAYFGRPADFDGLVFYTSNPSFDIWSVAAAFSASPESQALYGTGFSAATINAIYQNLFNRDAEPAGLLYWSTEVASGRLTAAGAAYAIFLGAQNEDKIAVENKMTVSAAFTAALDTAPEIIGYSGDLAAAAARAFLANVDSTAGSVTTAIAGLDAAVAAVVAAGSGGTIGDTYTLTNGVDSITLTTGVQIDTVNGVIDGDADADTSGATLSVGDLVQGNGHTVLRLAVAETGAGPFATLQNIDKIDFVAGAAGTVTLDAVDWTSVGSLNLVSGIDGLMVDVNNLDASTGFSIGDAISGSFSASYTNDTNLYLYADRAASVSFMGGSVTGVAPTAGDIQFNLWANAGATLAVGDVSLIGTKGTSASVTITNSSTEAADISVGNLTVTGFKDVDVLIGNTGATNAAGANVAVGDLTLAVNKSGQLDVGIYNSDYDSVGNLTVGNVNINAGIAMTGSVYVSQDGYASTAGADVTVGDLTVGDVSVTLATDASISYLVFSNAASVTNGSGTVGNLTVGNMTFNMGINSYLYGYNELDGGINGGTGGVDGGDVTVGNFNAVLDDGAWLGYYPVYNYMSAGSIGDVTQGDVTVSVGVSATASMWNDTYAYGNGSIGDYSRGNINLAAGINGVIWMSDYLYTSGTGDVGNITLGDVVMTAAKSATVSYSMDVSADTGSVGNISVGDLALTASAAGAVVNFMQETVTGEDVGTVTYGDVTLKATGENAEANVYIYTTVTDDAGDVTIGDVSMTVNNSAKKLGAEATFYVSVDGNVTAGDITVGSTSVRGATDSTMTYEANYTISSSTGTVSVGNITVTGGDGKSDNFHDLGAWLSLSGTGKETIGNVDYSGYTGSSSVTNIIDVSAYKGAAIIIGSAQKDTISDTTGTNVITGGSGADTFVFSTSNTGKTLATMDQVTDFSNSSDKLDVGVTVDVNATAAGVGSYGEASYADFASFVTGANAANRDVWVGQVTGSGLVIAVDFDGDDTVDFMVQLVGVNSLGSIDGASFV